MSFLRGSALCDELLGFLLEVIAKLFVQLLVGGLAMEERAQTQR